VTSEPDVVQIPLNGTEICLVVACDGLWDVVSKNRMAQVVVDHCLSKNQASLAQGLTSWARSLKSTDNVTVITVQFNQFSDRARPVSVISNA